MLVQLLDRIALSSLSIVSLRAYLNSHGWSDEGTWGERPVTVFAKDHADRKWEILVPHRDTLGGYAENMAESVLVLATVEERSQLDVFYDLKGAGADVIHVRSTNGLATDPLSLKQSATLLDDAYKMLAASARAVEKPQAAYRGKASSEVNMFLDKVLPFSDLQKYALRLHCPVSVEIGEQSDMGDEFNIPFPRKATYRLSEALSHTERAIERAIRKDTLDPFKEYVNKGVSANLCNSVSKLAKNGHGVSIDLMWAGVRPANLHDSHFEFSIDSADVLHQASKEFSRNEPSLDEDLIAQVVQLKREPEEFDGWATIVSALDERTMRMEVKFEQAVYNTVIGAFKDHANISLLGDIHPSGKGYELRNARRVIVLSEE